MTELFSNIDDEFKSIARLAWSMAKSIEDPIKAANFLNDVVEHCKNLYTEEEIEFLQFYFNMQMEMMKE